MAGDRPPPYGIERSSFLFSVVRGPVPRNRSIEREARSPSSVVRGPVPRNRSPTPMLGGGQAPALRLSGWLLFSVVRGPVPRNRSPTPMLGGGQAPALRYREKFVPIFRSARACPSRSFDDPVAWRGTGPRPTVIRAFIRVSYFAVFSVVRGPVPRNRSTTPLLGGGQAPALRYREKLDAWRGTGPRPTV